MLESIKNSVSAVTDAVLKSDPTLTPAGRKQILVGVRSALDPTEQKHTTDPIDTIIRRSEAARRLAVSPRTVDVWTRTGILRKVKLPGHTRSAGFRANDIAKLIGGIEVVQ